MYTCFPHVPAYRTTWKVTCSQVTMDMPRIPMMFKWRTRALCFVKMPMKYDCSMRLLIPGMWFSHFKFWSLFSFYCVGPWVWIKRIQRLLSILHFTPTWSIEEKKASYRKYLQNKTVDYYIEYKRHRAIVREMTRSERRDDWDKFVKTLERDITGT